MTEAQPANWEGSVSTLFSHCQNVYNLMLKQSAQIDLETDEPEYMTVYEGMLTKLITVELNLSVPYYTSILRALKRMGCVRQIRRGGGTSASQWELICPPTEEAFLLVRPRRAPKKGNQEMLQDQINALNGRVLVLEKALERLVEEESA